MKTNIKKALSIIIAVLMLFTSVPAAVFAAEDSYPVMEAYSAASSGDYHAYYNKVYTVTFLDTIDYDAISAVDTVASWDVSADKDASVMAWMKKNAEATAEAGADRYDVYIGGEGGVKANANSSYIFYCFSVLREVNGLENFKTDDVTTFFRLFEKCSSLKSLDMSSFNTSNLENMNYMLSECKSLESVNLSNWDTSNVTTMAYVFNNCHVLKEVDICSFDTNKVTNMNHLFYNCHELANIYIGEGWSIENVKNGDSVFNCCYALPGFDPSKTGIEFANPEDNGFLKTEDEKPQPEKKQYKVTYEYVGDVIPENAPAEPAETIYDEGTAAVVEANPAASGYRFSGWSTEDTTVENGSFTVNNDVHFVGSWQKVYKVIYKYKEGYKIPDEGAYLLPAIRSYAVGEVIEVNDLPGVENYVFVGWETEDVQVNDEGKFVMPENDVVLYGYYKIPVESIEISGGSFTLNVNDSSELKVAVKPDEATIKELVYESSDDSVATVDKSGKITAHNEGTATITVYSKDDPTKKDSITVTVKVPVTEVTVDKTEITLNKGDKDKINATVDTDATNKELEYKSKDETVVTVDENGNLEAVGEGTTTVTITSKDNPDVTETVTVTVKIPVTEVTARDDFVLGIGDEENLNASVNEDATNKELIYESENPGIVKVDNEGNVSAVGEGTTTITITSKDDPRKTTTVEVTVVGKYKVTYEYIGEVPEGAPALPEEEIYKVGDTVAIAEDPSVERYTFIGWIREGGSTSDTEFVMPEADVVLRGYFKIPVEDVVIKNADGENIVLDVGEEEKIDVEFDPSDATNKGVEYKSGDESIVTVDKDGKLTAISAGITTITVTSKDDPSKTDTIMVTVEVPVEELIPAEKEITIDIGENDKLEVTVLPENATDKSVTYESSNEDVVKVDENGNIEAVGKGEAVITITSKDDPTKTTTVKITVEVPVEELIADKTEVVLEPGDTDKITVTVKPDNASYPEVEYKSADEDVVKVDEKGNIEAVGEGETTIIVTSKDDPTKKVIISVKVEKPEEPTTEPTQPSEPEEPTTEPTEPSEPEEPTTEPTEPSQPEYTITVPEAFTIEEGETKNLGVTVTPDDGKIKPVYTSADESIIKVDAEGNITAVNTGVADITVDFGNGDIRIVTVTVTAAPTSTRTHFICFGKTDGIGWYEVSVNGGDFFLQGPNSTLEVEEGATLVVRVKDVAVGQQFTYYVNGTKVPSNDNNELSVVVDGYMLIGALTMDLEVPDVDESLTFFEKIAQFFTNIINWFKNLFK